MKHMMFLATVVAAMTICAPVSAQSRKEKKAAAKAQWEMEQKQKQEEAALLHEMKMDSIRNAKKAREAAQAQADEDARTDRARKQEIDNLQHAAQVSALNMQRTLEEQTKVLLIPCQQDVLDLDKGDNMAALGMSTEKDSKEEAMLDANRVGIQDLVTRFVGVLKNGVEQYSKDSRVKSGDRIKQSQLEGIAMAAGEKAINELFKLGDCREITKTRKGHYECYVALYIPVKQVVEAVYDAVEEAALDVDKTAFRNHLQAELDSQAAKQEAINQRKQEKLDALKAKAAEAGL